jgi:hypothetical protein
MERHRKLLKKQIRGGKKRKIKLPGFETYLIKEIQ